MTKLLLRLFVRDYKEPRLPRVRGAVGKLSGVVGIICNILLFAMKLVVGTISGSVAITADALNNLSDATSSIVTLIGFKLAEIFISLNLLYNFATYTALKIRSFLDLSFHLQLAFESHLLHCLHQ